LEPLKDSEISEQCQKYTELRPSYERLAHEVQFTLDHQLRKAGIEFSTVTHRAKTEESLREKLTMKNYSNPLEEVTDLAGVRIVYLYSNDFESIKKIISEEFKIIETVDKLSDRGVDKFGYVAVHFIIHLGDTSSGARYDDIKCLKCEIQVRTVLQDAWAIINHHLMYKREQDVPNPLLRKVNSLAGLLETADYQFDYIRSEREKYINEIESNQDSLMNQEINTDTLVAFLNHHFPDYPIENYKFVQGCLIRLDRKRYKTLGDLNNLLARQPQMIKDYNKYRAENRESEWDPSDMLYNCILSEQFA
jgi:putative GTP pyrophosphokinase